MKKGFTLIELIITIGLITVLGLVIVMNLGSNFSANQEKQYEAFKETFEKAACVYIDRNQNKTFKNTCKTNGSCNVTVAMLLSDGLIEDSDLKDPLSGEKIPDSTNVLITYTNGAKTCKFVE